MKSQSNSNDKELLLQLKLLSQLRDIIKQIEGYRTDLHLQSNLKLNVDCFTRREAANILLQDNLETLANFLIT